MWLSSFRYCHAHINEYDDDDDDDVDDNDDDDDADDDDADGDDNIDNDDEYPKLKQKVQFDFPEVYHSIPMKTKSTFTFT